jgi:predicted nuclease of restriction endonuclease-like (RecB) superfamily
MTPRSHKTPSENGTHCVPKLPEASAPLLPADTYAEIRDILAKARGKAIAAVNFAMVEAYWHIGRIIVEKQGDAERAPYGDKFMEELSRRLTAEFGPGFTLANVRNMRQFYQTFPIRYALRSELGWTHYRALLRVKNPDAVQWYMNEAANEGWSARALERQISVLYYDRMKASLDKASTRSDARENIAADPNAATPAAAIKNPLVLEFLGLRDYPALHERDLEQALIDHLQTFLLELGKGFCFVRRQHLVRMENRDFYIDLVFYNCILKCYVLVDLKIGELTYQDIGQMDGYLRLWEEKYRRPDDNPTIGLLLCSDRNEAVVKYSVLADNQRLFASKYLLQLPSEEELRAELAREIADAGRSLPSPPRLTPPAP